MANSKFTSLLKQYDYHLPPELVAQNPARPRDSARLLAYDRTANKTAYDNFRNLAKYLPQNAVLVFNQTKVIPARLTVYKFTGGKVELLYIATENSKIKVLANKKLRVGSTITINQKFNFKVISHVDQFYYLKPAFPTNQIGYILNKYGITPLPPYIRHSSLTEAQKRRQYQTVFAKNGISVAAPTASLHFTKQLLTRLKNRGIAVKFVTLDVNLGTFASLRPEQIKAAQLHSENYTIDPRTAKFLNLAKKSGRPIIAVGTTVVRTLESATEKSELINLTRDTKLFIRPPYKFKFVDGIITNFHVPKSSLLMLVSTFVGRKKLFELYQKAIKNKFRFFSFGDGMLIL